MKINKKRVSFRKRLTLALFFLSVILALITIGIHNPKRDLPLCMHDTPEKSLYTELAKLGEQPIAVGSENSKFAIERRGLGVVFTLNFKTGSWSFLTASQQHYTCFVAMGGNWHRVAPEIANQGGVLTLIPKERGKKRVGYSAPLETMKEILSKNNETLVGYGVQDIDLWGSPLSQVSTYLFTDSLGSFSAVTSVVYKNKSQSFITVLYNGFLDAIYKTKKHGLLEISSIDATGSQWTFDKKYEKYALK